MNTGGNNISGNRRRFSRSTDLRLVLLFFGRLSHTTQSAWSLLSGSDTLERWKMNNVFKAKDSLQMATLFLTAVQCQIHSILVHFIPSDNVMSLAWMPGSTHHKAGRSLEVQGVPSGRTSVLLKTQRHRYLRYLRHFSRHLGDQSVTAEGEFLFKKHNFTCFGILNYYELENYSK